jgi:hypothetical protein
VTDDRSPIAAIRSTLCARGVALARGGDVVFVVAGLGALLGRHNVVAQFPCESMGLLVMSVFSPKPSAVEGACRGPITYAPLRNR